MRMKILAVLLFLLTLAAPTAAKDTLTVGS